MKPNELHWLAGFLEGDGCFTRSHLPQRSILGRNKYDAVPKLQAAGTDQDTIERVAGYFNRRVSSREQSGQGTKRMFNATVQGKDAAAWMMTLYPLMSARRQARIREVLLEWRNSPFELPTWDDAGEAGM